LPDDRNFTERERERERERENGDGIKEEVLAFIICSCKLLLSFVLLVEKLSFLNSTSRRWLLVKPLRSLIISAFR
jgi:hypothetical protein